MASRSRKADIIEEIFNGRWDAMTRTLADSLVTIDDLKPYWPEGNIYAFFKDIVRNTKRANNIWPRSVVERGYTGRQEVGQGASFRFVPLAPGQEVPFVAAQTLMPTAATPIHLIESTSLPLASRQLVAETNRGSSKLLYGSESLKRISPCFLPNSFCTSIIYR